MVAAPRPWADMTQALLDVAREHQRTLQGSIPRRERDLREASASLDRNSALIVEIEARRKLAALPPLRPGQYEASDGLIRYAGTRELSPGELTALERHVIGSVGRALPVSAMGQSDVHTRLGLDHRHAVDLALHPDSVEGRVVMAWLRARGIAFLAYRAARSGAATGAHIHVGRPSERFTRASIERSEAPARGWRTVAP